PRHRARAVHRGLRPGGVRLARHRRGLLARGRAGRRRGAVRRGGSRPLPRLHPLDDHGARTHHPSGGPPAALAVPSGPRGARRAAAPLPRPPPVGRRRPGRAGGVADRGRAEHRRGAPVRRVPALVGPDPGPAVPYGGPAMTREPRRRRGFSPLRDLPVMGWLTALIVVVIAHPFLPAPKWLMLHLLLLGALSHSILVWSRHFADALLRTPERDPTAQRIRLGLHNGGALLVIAGVATDLLPLTAVGAASVAAAALWHGAALVARLRTALPSRFSITVRFYVAASCFLPIGALLGRLLARGFTEVWHERLKLAHAIVNLLGWAGLTVVGTLLTLWPAMLRTRMAEGAERATRRALPLLTAGIVTAAGGAIAGA